MKKTVPSPVRTIFRILLFAMIFIPFDRAVAQSIITVNGKYKDWNEAPGAVIGLVKLDNTYGRSYYAITKIDPQTTRVREYNASGVLTYTILVRFFNGKLRLITYTDQWGDTYEKIHYTYLGNDIFDVTETNTGENSFLPCKSAKYTYKNNMLTEIDYLSYGGTLCNNTDGVATIKYVKFADKDRFSLTKEKSFYDAGGNPVLSKGYGCFKVVYERDDRGNELSEAYYGVNDEPVTDKYGVFKYKFAYDQDDNETEKEDIGLDDQETLGTDSVARYGYTYQNGLLIQETRYDSRGNITKASATSDGLAIIKYQYDDRGNNTGSAYYDENGQPMNANWGVQKVVDTFSPLNMLIRIEYFDKDQAPAVDQYGIHEFSYENDNKNRITREAYYDKDNNPVESNTDQAYMVKYKYDELGRQTSESFWKDDTTKMNRWDGYHESVTKYNPDGQVTEYSYYDQSGNLFKTAGGFSRIVINYDTYARRSEVSLFDGNLPVIKTGNYMVTNFQSVKFFYDNNQRISSLEYLDSDGNPVNAAVVLHENFSCAKIEFVYQGDRIIQENCYQANSDTPVKIIDCLKNDYIYTNGVQLGYKNQ